MAHHVDEAVQRFASILKPEEIGQKNKTSNKITCPKCGNLFRDPVRIPECGHTFCQRCIWAVPLDANEGDGHLNVKIGQDHVEHLRMLIDTLEPEKRSDAEDDESEEEVEPEIVFTEKWIRVKQKLEFINPREYPVAAIKLLWNGKTLQDEDYIKDTPGIRDESSVWAEIDQEVIEMLRRKQKENPNRCYICRALITHHYTDVPINKSLMGLVNEYKSLSKVFGEW